MKKRFKAIELKHLDEKTIKQIRMWRNQPFVRKVSLNQHEITEEEHERFVKGLKGNDNKKLYVFYLDDKPFGVFHYRIDPREQSVIGSDYLVDEEYLGYGLIMAYFINEIYSSLQGISKYKAEVIGNNKKVLSFNEKIGYKVVGVIEKSIHIDGRYYDVYQLESRKEDEKDLEKVRSLVYEFIEREPIEDVIFD